MEDRIVIQGEIKGSKAYFRSDLKKQKKQIDCVGLIIKKLRRKKKSSK